MPSFKWKVGMGMIERRWGQLNDIGFSTQMVRVTHFTLYFLAVFHKAVKAFSFLNVLSYFLMIMAVETEVALLVLLERLVAVFAFQFDLFRGH